MYTPNALTALFWRGVLLLLSAGPLLAAARSDSFMLTFTHPEAGSYYLPAIYEEGRVYLPVGELFRILEIPITAGSGPGVIRGSYPENSTWEISPDGCSFSQGKEFIPFSSRDICREEMDVFLLSSLFDELFGLDFRIDMQSLHLTLKSRFPLPVELRGEREQKRREQGSALSDSAAYPLLFPLKRHGWRPGVLDYSVGITMNEAGENTHWQTTGGVELLGGALQGSAYGFHNRDFTVVRTGNLHWRFLLPTNRWITQFRAGQLHSAGLSGNTILGWSITNEPAMPRRRYDNRIVTGVTVPGSEVELHVNRMLIGYAEADSSGYYRLEYPLNYGTSRQVVSIYTPWGTTINREKEIRVPYEFLPEGTFTYNLQGGRIIQGSGFATDEEFLVHGDLAWGLSNTVTVGVGTDHFSASREYFFYGTLDARIFDYYLFHADFLPGTRYRFFGEVTWPGSRSARFAWTDFDGRGWFNPSGLERYIHSGIYFPVTIFDNRSGFCVDLDYQFFEDKRQSAGTRIDLYTRVSRMNLRFNFHNRVMLGHLGQTIAHRSIANVAATRTFRHPFGGSGRAGRLFVRLQTQFDVVDGQFASVGLELINSLTRTARVQLKTDYLVPFRQVCLQATLTVDLPAVRATSLFNSRLESHRFVQQFSGSFALDAENSRWTAVNRNQAGQGMASIRMFIDSDSDGAYTPGEEIVPCKAVRITPGARQQLGKDGVLRVMQLQPYWHYRVELPEGTPANPTLVPRFHHFSFVADPNQFKPIDIPLYRTGVVEGIVYLAKNSEEPVGTGGIRLLLRGPDRESLKILRTFSDGRFYAMNLLPGNYTLEVDPLQHDILKATCQPGMIPFKVKALPVGDYIGDLQLTLTQDE